MGVYKELIEVFVIMKKSPGAGVRSGVGSWSGEGSKAGGSRQRVMWCMGDVK